MGCVGTAAGGSIHEGRFTRMLWKGSLAAPAQIDGKLSTSLQMQNTQALQCRQRLPLEKRRRCVKASTNAKHTTRAARFAGVHTRQVTPGRAGGHAAEAPLLHNNCLNERVQISVWTAQRDAPCPQQWCATGRNSRVGYAMRIAVNLPATSGPCPLACRQAMSSVGPSLSFKR